LQEYDDFKEWISPPLDAKLQLFGFPNVIVMILPDNKISTGKQ